MCGPMFVSNQVKLLVVGTNCFFTQMPSFFVHFPILLFIKIYTDPFLTFPAWLRAQQLYHVGAFQSVQASHVQ